MNAEYYQDTRGRLIKVRGDRTWVGMNGRFVRTGQTWIEALRHGVTTLTEAQALELVKQTKTSCKS